MDNEVITDGRVVDASVIARVSDHLRRRHSTLVDAFAVITVAEEGVSATLVDAGSGAAFAHRLAPGTSGPDLDVLISDHLVRAGRVDAPESDEWAAELRLLSYRGRHRLAESDGTFIMGEEHVRLFRVTRRDVAQSTLARAEHVPDAVAQSAESTGRRVSALVFDSSHNAWPGLPEILAPVTDVPIVVLDDVALTIPAATTEQPSVAAPEQVPEPTIVREPVGETTDIVGVDWTQPPQVTQTSTVEHVPSGQPAIHPAQPPTQQGRSVDNEFDVTDRIEPIALAYSARLATRDEAAHPDRLVYPAEPGVDLRREVENGCTADELVAAPSDSQPLGAEAGGAGKFMPRSRRRIAVGVGAVGVIGVAVALTALGLSDGAAAPSASVPVTTTQAPTTTQLYADLADLNEARAPAATYVPPPPPPPPSQTEQSDTTPRPRGGGRPKPKPRAVIPLPGGLPPIVVP